MSTIPVNATPTEALHRSLQERLEAAFQTVEGGPWDGIEVITSKDLQDVFEEPLPPASGHGAEVMTPARVVVDAYCPRCSLPSTIALIIEPELRVDHSGATLRLVGRSKPVGHLCGQTAFAFNGEAEDQEDFSLSDIVADGESDEARAGKGEGLEDPTEMGGAGEQDAEPESSS